MLHGVQSIGKGTFKNKVGDIVEGIPVSEVKPGGKDEQKRLIYNASSDSPAKKQTFQSLLEFWGGGGQFKNDVPGYFEDLESEHRLGPGNTQPIGRE